MYSLPPSLSTASVGLTLLGPLVTWITCPSAPTLTESRWLFQVLPVQSHPEPASAVSPHIVRVARQVSEVLRRAGLGAIDPVPEQLARPGERDHEVCPVGANGEAIGVRDAALQHRDTTRLGVVLHEAAGRVPASPVAVTLSCCDRG